MNFTPSPVLSFAATIVSTSISIAISASSTAFAATSDSPSEKISPSAIQVPEISVLGASEISLQDRTSTISLTGSRLNREKRSTLGETLANQSGVTSSQFGPNASRPVVRGHDGDRIRILQNGTGVLDASAASQDHAVASDPLIIERIEVIQGPAALLYGNSTIGGAVNVIVRRIPETPLESFQGTFESRFATNDGGRSAGFSLEGPIELASKKWLYHFDGTVRAADDYKTSRGDVTNSFNRSLNGAVGTSYVTNDSFAGISYSSYDSRYGTVAEKAVHIDMRQQKFDFSGGLRNVGILEAAKLKSTVSNYQHQEISNGATGTTFKNQGAETRLDLLHHRAGPFNGTFGAQHSFFIFEALGDEAFLPRTNNQSTAAFVFEEADLGSLKPAIAARIDRVSVGSEVAADKVSTFGASQTKNFTTKSLSLGFRQLLSETLTANFGASYTERAPNYQELFANGPHVATGIFEIGDSSFSPEASKSIEAGLRAKGEIASGNLSVFAQDFANYISLAATGGTDAGSSMPISSYRSVPARLIGGEFEYRHKLPNLLPGGVFEIEFKADFVQGRNLSTGASLPRQPPLRESLAFIYKTDEYQVDAEIRRAEKQVDLAPGERETNAYTLFNLGIEVPVCFDNLTMSIMGRALNLFDVEARNHVSILKEIAPLPGRSFNLAIQASF